MKKVLFLAIIALFMCSCEEKTGVGCINVNNYTGKSLCIDVFNMKGDLCHQRVANGSYIYMILPTGKYKATGSYLPFHEKQEKICVVPDNAEITISFYRLY